MDTEPKVSRCKNCGDEIYWATVQNGKFKGKKWAINKRPSESGDISLTVNTVSGEIKAMFYKREEVEQARVATGGKMLFRQGHFRECKNKQPRQPSKQETRPLPENVQAEIKEWGLDNPEGELQDGIKDDTIPF